MKSFTAKFLRFLPLLFIVVYINYTIDPANLFLGGAYEQGIARLMLEGHNVANVTNLDHRALQKLLINGTDTDYDMIVLGSSRAMQVQENLFKESKVFNHAVPGASIEDFIAIHYLYVQRDKVPPMIVVVTDPWLFNGNNGQTRWRSLPLEYQRGMERLGMPLDFINILGLIDWEKYSQLVSFSYLQEGVAAADDLGNYYSSSTSEAKEPILRADGSYSYGEDVRNRGVEDVRQLAADYVLGEQVYALDGFFSLDENLMRKFEGFVNGLLADRINVVLVLSPYHPESYRLLIERPNYQSIQDAEAYLISFAEENGIPLIGSYDPLKAGCTDAEFYDGMHPREVCIEKIFANFPYDILQAGQ